MFKILSTHPSQGGLDLSTKIVNKAQSVGSNALDLALYDSANFFIVNAPKTKGVDDVEVDGKTSLSASDGKLATGQRSSADFTSEVGDQGVVERFQPLLMAVFASPLEPWQQPERARKSRVELALALARQHMQDPAALVAILDNWLVEERSRPLREELERARQACKRDL